MTGEPSVIDLANVALQLVELRGEVKELGTDLRGRDRNTEQLVKFAAEQGQKNAEELVELRKEIRDLLKELATTREESFGRADDSSSAVRVDLERQLRDLRAEVDGSLQRLDTDITSATSRLDRVWGGLALVTFVGLPGVAALVRFA